MDDEYYVIDMPVCAVCHTPIDKLVKEYFAETNEFVFRAYCHGDVEETRVAFADVVDLVGEIEPGVAFKTKKIPETTATQS